MRWLLFFFIAVPFIELYILIYLSEIIGFWTTLGSVILIGTVGFHLARSQGFLLFGRVRQQINQGMVPGNEVLDALIVVASGLLLVTPGVITDIVGLVMLTPRLRLRIRELFKGWLLQYLKLGFWKFNKRKL